MGSTSAVEVEGAVDTFRFVVLSVRRRLSVSLSLSLSFLVAASADCCLSLFFFLFFLSLLFFSLLSSAAGGSSHISFFFLWGSPHVSTRAPSPHTRRDRVDRLSTNDAAERLCGDFYSHSAAPSKTRAGTQNKKT